MNMSTSSRYSVPAVTVHSADEQHPVYKLTAGRVPVEQDTPASNRYAALREAEPEQEFKASYQPDGTFTGEDALEYGHVQPYGECHCCSEMCDVSSVVVLLDAKTLQSSAIQISIANFTRR